MLDMDNIFFFEISFFNIMLRGRLSNKFLIFKLQKYNDKIFLEQNS